MKQTRCVLLFAVIIAAAAMGARADEPAAKTIARQLKFTKGLALDVGCGDGSLAIELTELTQLKFHGVEADPAAVDRARQRVVKAGLYGTRVTISRGELARPTYPERSANLIVFGDQLADGLRGRDLKGIYRLLNPNGAMVVGQGSAVAAKAASPLTKDQLVAWLKAAGIDHYEIVTTGGIWAVVLRGAEPGWDEWTHRGHDPANTYASADRLDLGKLKLQWAQPSQPGLASAGILVAGGRLIEVGRGYEGHADTTPYIQVSDAFNGTVLWSRVGAKELPIDRGLGEYSPIRACSDLAVAGEGLYVLAGKRCCVFDVATGKHKPAIPIPPEAGAGDADIWLYVAILGNRLYGSIGPSPKHHLKGFSGWGGPHWRGISTAVFSLDLATGKLRWARRGPAATASIVITGDRLLFLDDKQRVRGLSLADGKELFAVASGIPAEAKVTNVAAYRGRYWVMYADDGAVHSKARDLGWEMAVFSTADGKLQFRPDPGSAVASMSFSEGRAFMAPQHATGQIYAIHTDTGKVAQEMLPRPTGSKCTPVLATPDWLLYRHQAGSGFVRIDRASGDRHVYSRIRCTCHYPGLPAAGLLFVQGPGCNCAHPFRANVALAPGDRKRTQYKDPGQRLVTGPAAGKPAAGEASKGVWATWRADIRRSGRTAHDLPERLGVAWSVQPGRELTPPVLAEGMVFVGSTARKMIALDAATGKARWQFIAVEVPGGPGRRADDRLRRLRLGLAVGERRARP